MREEDADAAAVEDERQGGVRGMKRITDATTAKQSVPTPR